MELQLRGGSRCKIRGRERRKAVKVSLADNAVQDRAGRLSVQGGDGKLLLLLSPAEKKGGLIQALWGDSDDDYRCLSSP